MSAPGPRRIVVDALAARYGGTAYAVVHLARQLAGAVDVEAVCVVTRAGSIVDLGLDADTGLEIVALPARGRLEALLRRLGWEAARLPRLLKRFHATDCVTISGILPTRLDVPVTSYLLNPVPFQRRGAANLLRRAAIVRTAHRSASVIVPTEAMADLVQPHAGRRPVVVPLGVERSRFRPGRRAGSEVLVVADFYPHKRHDLVLEAWARLAQPRPCLRLIGNRQPDEGWASRITTMIAALDPGEEIVVEHGLPLAQLIERYRSARVFLMPSELESFCMPLAEALTCGVPGVVRGDPVLRETGGRGCLYVEGSDPQTWAATLQQVIDGDELHRSLRRAGLTHAKAYTFERMRDGLLAHLGSTASEPAQTRRSGSHASWLLSASLWALLGLVLVAAVAAREIAAPGAAPPTPVTTPVSANATYGRGLERVIPSPVRSLAPIVGDTWRQLDPPDGRANVVPLGAQSRYFQLGFIAYSGASARLAALQTSAGEERVLSTPGDGHFAVVTLGPLRATPSLAQGIALFPKPKPGAPPVALSPLETRWLQPGDAVLRQDSLRQAGPGGISGQYMPVGQRIELAVTPGLHGATNVELTMAADRIAATVEVVIAGVRKYARIQPRATRVRLGPFRAGRVLHLRFYGSGTRVLVASARLRAAAPARGG